MMTVFSPVTPFATVQSDMHITRSAILAFVIIVTTCVYIAPAATLAGNDLEKPVRVRFQLADGARVDGDITQWDDTGITGTFGSRLWSEIVAEDVWRLYRALMDTQNVVQWVKLGGTLLTIDEGEKFAERAFATAQNLNEDDARPLIDIARADAQQILEERREQQQKIEAQKLNTGNPEAAEYTRDPWPSLSDTENDAITTELKSQVNGLFERAGIDPTVIQTDRFLFYSQMQREDAIKWARVLDRMYETLAGALLPDLRDPSANNIFAGKAVVICFSDYDRFQLTEAELFNHLSPRSVHGLMHPIDAKVYINIWRDPDNVAFGELLCRLTTHAFLHRCKAPRRLPYWANEGLALWATDRVIETSTVQPIHRARALQFIRSGGDVRAALSFTYADAENSEKPRPAVAQNAADIAADVGYLLVEMLLRENPAAFQQWIADAKTGKDWPDALAEAYKTPINTIIDRFAQWYRVNN